jgi:hypothetical protein
VPPEDIADAAYEVLTAAAGGAIHNWAEGFWDDFSPSTTRREMEPALICSKPDGTGVMVLAHTVVPVDPASGKGARP